MTKVEFKNLQIGQEYYIKPFLFNADGNSISIEEGIYKVINKYNKMESAPSSSRDLGNGLYEVLNVAYYKQVNYIVIKNSFSGEERIISDDLCYDIAQEFYIVDHHDRHIQFGYYKAKEILKKVKNKETYYVVTETLEEDVASTCIILDVRYSKTRDYLIYIILDVHNGKINSFKETKIAFPDLEELDPDFIELLNKKEEME